MGLRSEPHHSIFALCNYYTFWLHYFLNSQSTGYLLTAVDSMLSEKNGMLSKMEYLCFSQQIYTLWRENLKFVIFFEVGVIHSHTSCFGEKLLLISYKSHSLCTGIRNELVYITYITHRSLNYAYNTHTKVYIIANAIHGIYFFFSNFLFVQTSYRI